jgi:hypothetical protein
VTDQTAYLIFLLLHANHPLFCSAQHIAKIVFSFFFYRQTTLHFVALIAELAFSFFLFCPKTEHRFIHKPEKRCTRQRCCMPITAVIIKGKHCWSLWFLVDWVHLDCFRRLILVLLRCLIGCGDRLLPFPSILPCVLVNKNYKRWMWIWKKSQRGPSEWRYGVQSNSEDLPFAL